MTVRRKRKTRRTGEMPPRSRSAGKSEAAILYKVKEKIRVIEMIEDKI